MLGIQYLRGQRREPEEAGVELRADPVKKRGDAHTRRIASVLSLTPPASRSPVRTGDDRLLTAPKVAPERRNILGAREIGWPCRPPRSRSRGCSCSSSLYFRFRAGAASRFRKAALPRAGAPGRDTVSALLSAGSIIDLSYIKSAVRSSKRRALQNSAKWRFHAETRLRVAGYSNAIRRIQPSSVRGLLRHGGLAVGPSACSSPQSDARAHIRSVTARAAPRLAEVGGASGPP